MSTIFCVILQFIYVRIEYKRENIEKCKRSSSSSINNYSSCFMNISFIHFYLRNLNMHQITIHYYQLYI